LPILPDSGLTVARDGGAGLTVLRTVLRSSGQFGGVFEHPLFTYLIRTGGIDR